MISFRMLRHSDRSLWFCAGALLVIGFLALFSATYMTGIKSGGDPFFFVRRQFSSLFIAILAMGFGAYLDVTYYKKLSPWIYGVMIFSLLAVMFIGSSAAGAQRWISLGFFKFQPSEFSKLMSIMVIAAYLENKRGKIKEVLQLLPFLAMVAIPCLLIFKQPDLGTALVVIAISLGMLGFAEASPVLFVLLLTPFVSIVLSPFLWAWIIYLAILFLTLYLFRVRIFEFILAMGINIGVGLAFPLIWGMLRDYQRMRILSFLNPGLDPYGVGYHTLQSKIAIGSGFLFGKGFLHGTQTQLQFIPVQQSDFIFAVIGEEWGFIGGLVLLALFLVIVYRAFALAFETRDSFSSFVAAGIGVMILFHVFVNIGMTTGMLPVVGIPLPLVSFGGSSLVVTLMSIGILQSIAMRRHKLIF
ncbi:MAG: rod shape-determining protein RodA [Candidatus Saganbacteria bacterium]|nr:rod shape-determining protein RodA [Candidatus Saganbacteria bacterium]